MNERCKFSSQTGSGLIEVMIGATVLAVGALSMATMLSFQWADITRTAATVKRISLEERIAFLISQNDTLLQSVSDAAMTFRGTLPTNHGAMNHKLRSCLLGAEGPGSPNCKQSSSKETFGVFLVDPTASAVNADTVISGPGGNNPGLYAMYTRDGARCPGLGAGSEECPVLDSTQVQASCGLDAFGTKQASCTPGTSVTLYYEIKRAPNVPISALAPDFPTVRNYYAYPSSGVGNWREERVGGVVFNIPVPAQSCPVVAGPLAIPRFLTALLADPTTPSCGPPLAGTAPLANANLAVTRIDAYGNVASTTPLALTTSDCPANTYLKGFDANGAPMCSAGPPPANTYICTDASCW